VAPGVAGYDVVLTEIAANVDELAVSGKANLAGLLTTQPTFSITFASPTIDLKKLFARMPPQWIHPQLPGIVEQRQLGGTVEIVSATLTGATAPSPQLSLTGDFRIEKGTALIGNDRVPTQDLSATISVEPGRIRVGKVTGSYGTLQMTDGKAVVSFLDEGPWMELDISGNMTAADLVKFLTKTIRADRLTSLLAQSREIEGQTHPTFRLVGPLDKPEGITFAGGEVLAEQVSLVNPSLPQRLTAMHGRILFSQTGGAQFDQVTANVGETQLQFNGMISGGTPSVFQDFVIRARGSAAQLRQMVSAGTFPDDLLYGMVNAKVQLSGASGAPHLRGEIGLNDAKLVLPMVGEKPFGSPASLELDADVTRGVGLVISRMELVIPPLRLPLKGHITLGDQFSIDASLASGYGVAVEPSRMDLPQRVRGGESRSLHGCEGHGCRMEKLAHGRMAGADQRPDVGEGCRRPGRGYLPPAEIFQEHRRYQTALLPHQGQRCQPVGGAEELDDKTGHRREDRIVPDGSRSAHPQRTPFADP
jgi:hypothetical protein